MSIDLGSGKRVLSMTLVDMDSGRETVLFEREGSRCHFNKEIHVEDYIITLRVDWGDIQNTDPVLDADIYLNVSGKSGGKLRNGNWHHTFKEDASGNCRVYDFSFKNLKLRLGAKMAFSLSTSMDAIIVKEGHDKSKA